jgi:DNA-binding response OmpR family regulator
MIPRPRVLVVEDDPLALMMLTLELQADGFEVEGADTAHEAQALLAGAWDALVCDLDLRTGTDGYALAQSARAANRAIVVLYTSGVARPEFEGRKVPGAGLAPKPFIPQEIAQRLHRLLETPPQA